MTNFLLLAAALAFGNDVDAAKEDAAAVDKFVKECLLKAPALPGAETPVEESEECRELHGGAAEAAARILSRLRDEGSPELLEEARRLWPLLDEEARERLLPAIRKEAGPKRGKEERRPEPAFDLEASGAAAGLTDALNARAPGLGGYFDGSAARGSLGVDPAAMDWARSAGAGDARIGYNVPSSYKGLPGSGPVMRAVPAGSTAVEAPEPRTWGETAWEGGKRLLHSAGSLLALPFEAVGTGIQTAAGAASVVTGTGMRAAGWVLGSEDLSRRGGIAAARGGGLLLNAPARAVNALARPAAALVDPGYEVFSARGRYGRVVAALIDPLVADRYQDGEGALDVIARDTATTDTLLNHHLERISGEGSGPSKGLRYGLAYAASFADKASQALLGGPALKEAGGRMLHAMGLGSMAVGAGEQAVEHYKEFAEAKTPQAREAALAKMVKSAGDMGVMLGAGAAGRRSGETGPGPRFLDSVQARDLVIDAASRLQHVKRLLKENGRPEMLPAEERAVFQALLRELVNPPNGPKTAEGPVGIAVFDNDAGLLASPRWKRLGLDAAWLDRMGLVVDHHGPYFDPKNPEVDSTMKLLDRIEAAVASDGADAALKTLRRELANTSTNNLGDGAWADVLAHNLERAVRDPGFRRAVREATSYEDFGFFGAKAAERARTDPAAARALELQHAAFRVYDEALQRHGLKGSDRFDSLPAVEQGRLMARVRSELMRAVEDPEYRRSQAREFEVRLEDAKRQVEAARFGLDEASRGALEARGVPASALDGIFIYDASRISADGVFAGWGAAPQARGGELLLGVRPMADGRTGFILSVPNGMEDAPSLAALGRALQASESAREGGKPGTVGGRDALQFSFDGLRMSPQELLMALAEARAKEAPAAGAPSDMRSTRPSGLRSRLDAAETGRRRVETATLMVEGQAESALSALRKPAAERAPAEAADARFFADVSRAAGIEAVELARGLRQAAREVPVRAARLGEGRFAQYRRDPLTGRPEVAIDAGLAATAPAMELRLAVMHELLHHLGVGEVGAFTAHGLGFEAMSGELVRAGLRPDLKPVSAGPYEHRAPDFRESLAESAAAAERGSEGVVPLVRRHYSQRTLDRNLGDRVASRRHDAKHASARERAAAEAERSKAERFARDMGEPAAHEQWMALGGKR